MSSVDDIKTRRPSASTMSAMAKRVRHAAGTAGDEQSYRVLEPASSIRARNMTDLTDRVAVVIGATSGLGRAIALGLAEAGATVVPSGRRQDCVDEVCNEVAQRGRHALSQTVDVRQRESIDCLRDATMRAFGRIDILINAAGCTLKKPTLEVDEAEWSSLMDINLAGVLRSCQSFFEPLRASGRGRVVNIASLASFVAFHEVTAYGASKAGVLALTRSLGAEWAKQGIIVNAIAPGIFPTDLNAEILNGTDRGKELLLRTPLGRYGHHEELVGAAVFLSSDCASFIVGQLITVDGGFLASGVNT